MSNKGDWAPKKTMEQIEEEGSRRSRGKRYVGPRWVNWSNTLARFIPPFFTTEERVTRDEYFTGPRA